MMRRALIWAAVLAVPLAAAPPEPLVGTWRLERQEINGEVTKSEPLTLKITQTGDRLAFAFSVPVNNIYNNFYFVGMSYTLRLDGTAADITNGRGETIGSIQMSSDGPSQYKLALKGLNRPDSLGKLTVSPDGKSLTSEGESMQGGRTVKSKQVFLRF